MKSKRLLLLAVLASAASAFASDKVSAGFRLVAPALAPLSVGFESGGKPALAEIPQGGLSAAVDYKGPARVVFREASGPKREFAADLPPGKARQMIVLLQDSAGGTSTLLIEDSAAAFPQDALLMVNIGQNALKVKAGTAEADLAPGGRMLFPPSGKPTLFVQVMQAGDRAVLASNNWALAPGTRTLVFLDSTAGDASRVTVHRLTDGNPPKP